MAMAMAGQWRAHVVLVPMFSPSHSMPCFDLALRLASLGVKVTILSADYHVKKLWSDPLYWRWAPRLRAEGSIDVVAVQDGLYDGTWLGFWNCVSEQASKGKLVDAFGAALRPLMSTTTTGVPKPCCVVSDTLLGWTQGLAAKFAIPRYVLHIQPASNLSLLLHMPNLIAEGRVPLTKENQTKLVPVPGFKFPLHPSDLVTEIKDEKFVKMGAYDNFVHISRRALQAPIILVNTFREFEEDFFINFDNLRSQASMGQQVPKVIPVGPLLLPEDFPSPGAASIEGETSEEIRVLMQWLDSQPPRSVLYIAFGTLVQNKQERLQEIAFALEASKQTFLWAAGTPIQRPNEPPPTPVSHFLPPGFEERTRNQGKVVTIVVPQIHILKHAACGAFISHCGWNAVLESVTSGVPLIAWPQQYEQWMTARYLVDTVKVAAELKKEEESGFVGREEIQRVVHLVMHQEEGKAIRLRMVELQKSAAKYAYSNSHLDSFVDGL